jgi:hypothetical protein
MTAPSLPRGRRGRAGRIAAAGTAPAAAGAVIAALVLPLAAAALVVAVAQPRGVAAQAPDYLFEPPQAALTLRGGVFLPRARSDLHDFLQEYHTVQRGDFAAGAFAVELGLRAHERVDLVFGAGHAAVKRATELRDFEEDDAAGSAIRQELRQSQTPLTVGVRGYLIPPGRAVGRLAWVPSAVAPYLGGGVGITRGAVQLEGEFVDYETWDIFYDRYRSSGLSPAVYAAAGVELRIGRQFGVVGEVRREWSEHELGPAFEGFEPLDLTGSRVTLGMQWRF